MSRSMQITGAVILSLVFGVVAGAGRRAGAPAPADNVPRAERQKNWIATLQSDAPKAEKAITCKHLAIWGDREAVPALAPLLADSELASWARIALEAIPGPEADAALRAAMEKVQGRLLVGVINSLGVRRDAAAVPALAARLKDADGEVVSAAAAALGKIATPQAAAALQPLLGAPDAGLRAAAAEGCVLCAERFLAAGQRDEAMKLYDAVRAADVPGPRTIEAIRGAILARGAEGVPLLVEQLRSGDPRRFNIGLRVARELKVPAVTDAILAELPKAQASRQSLLLLALADRGDARAVGAATELLRTGAPEVRAVAARVLERIGGVSCVPVLLEAAAGEDAAVASAARTALARLPGKDVDADILARLEKSSGKSRQVLIEVAEHRRIDGALALFVKYAEDADAGVRSAAITAIGAVGDEKQMADLARLLQKTQDAKDRGDLEKALMSISGRSAAAAVKHLLPLAQAGDAATRMVAINALACCGGAEALAAVKAALADRDEAVQDEAARALSTWPNRWPDDAAAADVLAEVARTAAKPSHKALALRGCFQFIQGARKMKPENRLARVTALLPLLSRPEEKRLAISALGTIGTGPAIEELVKLADDPQVAEEASSAIVNAINRSAAGLSKEQRNRALQAVISKSKSDNTRKRAQELLGK